VTRQGGQRQAVIVAGKPHACVGAATIFLGDRESLVDSVVGLASDGRAHLVITPNVDQLLDLELDDEWRRVFESAALRVVDGTPLLWLFRLLGASSVSKHSGADLLPYFTACSAKSGYKIAVTGGDEAVLREGVRRLKDRFPGANISAVSFPMISSIGDPGSLPVISALRQLAPDIVFVCLGAPKQEKWVDYWRAELPPAAYIGAGAAIDFAAGALVRAPRVMQIIGLEWLWRVGQEPRRLATRYFVKGPRFILIVARSLRASRRLSAPE